MWNLVYFENATMHGLYNDIEAWQGVHKKQMLSLSIQRERDLYCCIALTGPCEVVIVSGDGSGHRADVNSNGILDVHLR